MPGLTEHPNLKTTFADNSPFSEELTTKGLNNPNTAINNIATELGNDAKSAALEAPAASATAVVNLLGQLKQAIKNITGGANWYSSVAATISAIWAKFDDTTGHTHSGTADDGPQIDSNGLADNSVITNRIEDGAVTTTKIADGDVTQEKIDTDLKYFREGLNDFVASGGVWSADSFGVNLLGSMTAVVVYVSGKRVTAGVVSAHAFTASKHTAVDLGIDGTIDYNEGASFSAMPALAADHIRLAVIVTDATVTTQVYDRRNLDPTTIARCELLEGTATNVSIESLPDKDYFEVVFLDNESTSKILVLRFNNDSGNNYAWRKSVNGAADTTLGTTSGIPGESTSGTREILQYKVANLVTHDEKPVTGTAVHSGSGGVANAPGKDDIAGKWVSGASVVIHTIHITNTGAGAIAAGSKLIIKGHD